MGRRHRSASDDRADVNIAPLIDIVFILLIFFMVSTTFIRDAKVDVERPAAAQVDRADPRSVRVTIGRGGDVFVDDQPTNVWMVQSRVRELVRRGRVNAVLVVADRRVETGRLISVVDQCRAAGAKNVGVAVEPQR